MTTPQVIVTTRDNQLGIVPPSGGAPITVVGACTSGAEAQPTPVGRVEDLISAFTSGPAVQFAAHLIARYGARVIMVRTGQSVTGSADTLNIDGVTGTAEPAFADGIEPLDDFDVRVRFTAGGAVGTAGIKYQESLDDGRNWSPVKALGTATSITIPGSGVEIDVGEATDTIIAGDEVFGSTTAPQWSDPELTAALTAVKNSSSASKVCCVIGECDATALQVIDTAAEGMAAVGKRMTFAAHVGRETFSAGSFGTYASDLESEFSGAASSHVALYAGSCEMSSDVDGRRYTRPSMFVAAPHEFTRSEETNAADLALGALPCTITDDDGNPKYWNEYLFGGLDDLRFTVLRTHPGREGVYVNRPRVFSASGSDFKYSTYRRVYNLAAEALDVYLQTRLNRPIRVSKATGLILEEDALDIESGGRAVLRAVLGAKPKASAWEFTVSRSDNLLSTETLTVSSRIVPLAYPVTINLDLGFMNPAVELV